MAFDYSLRFTGQDDLSGVLGKVKKEIKDMGKEASNVELVDKAMGKIITSSGKLNTKVKQTSALLAEMKFDGDYNAEQFLKVAQAAGNAKDAISDTQAMVKFFADDRRWLNTTVQGFQALAGIGSIAAGTMSLFGIESENATRAIQGCQTALSILNGITTVANLLDKEGYLMTAKKILGLNAQAAAETKVTAATNAATGAQIKNNLAVLANPYVAAAVAIAALAGGIIYWVSTMDDATEEQQQLNAAVDAFTEAADQQYKQLGEQLAVFESLKKTYDESGGKTDILTKKILNNKEAQRKLGVTLKTVDDVHRLFGRNSQNYINASIARANALAAEAAQATVLGAAMSELSKIMAKVIKGEEVNYSDLEAIYKKAGISQQRINKEIGQAGGKSKFELFGKNDLDVPDYAREDFATEILKNFPKAFIEDGIGKILSKAYEDALSKSDLSSIDFNDLLTKNQSSSSGSSGSGSKGGSGSGSSGSGTDTNKPEKDSLADLKQRRDAINQAIQRGNLTQEELVKKMKEMLGLERQIEQKEKELADLRDKWLKELMQNMTVSESGLTKQLDGLGDQLSQFVKYWNDKLVFKPKVEPLTPEQINKNVKAASQKLVNDLEEQKTKRETEALEKKKKTVNAVGDSFAALGSIASSVGQMTDDKAINAAAIIAQAIANYILGWTEATAKAASLGPIGWAAFGLATLAQVAAVVAQIHSLSGYASGGIISGGSSYGDQILARVNAGEMVLNRKQQSNLFRAIESGDIGAGQTVLVPEFKIKGSDLYGTLRNFSKSVGKTGKVTGIR